MRRALLALVSALVLLLATAGVALAQGIEDRPPSEEEACEFVIGHGAPFEFDEELGRCVPDALS